MPLDWNALMNDEKVISMLSQSIDGFPGQALFGCYVLLLKSAWFSDSPGTLPNDDVILSAITRLDPSTWQKVKPVIMSPFKLSGERYHQKKMRQVYQAVCSKLKKQSEGGKMTAAKRWNNKPPDSLPISKLQVSNRNLTELNLTELNTKKFHSLEALDLNVEEEAMQAAMITLGEKAMKQFGGVWRKRWRENAAKFIRVMSAMVEEQRERALDNPGGYADDLWRRFAD